MRERRGVTSDACLKERTAERTLTAMQRMAAREVRKLKQRHATKKGSGLFVLVTTLSSTTSPFRDIFVEQWELVIGGNRQKGGVENGYGNLFLVCFCFCFSLLLPPQEEHVAIQTLGFTLNYVS